MKEKNKEKEKKKSQNSEIEKVLKFKCLIKP